MWQAGAASAMVTFDVDPRLQGAISSARVRFQAADLVRLALAALDDLRRLDEGLYERFVATRAREQEAAVLTGSLRELWDDTFRGLLQLLALCRALGAVAPAEPAAVPEVDFGDLGGSLAEVEGLDLGSSDIGDLLDGLGGLEEAPSAPHREEAEGQRWDKVLASVGSIEYGLRSQYSDAKTRFDAALASGDTNAALGLLDDAQSGTSEGAHALVAAVYVSFVPEVDTATVVPGYLTSLGRALLVRRGIAELTATLGASNVVLQSSDAGGYPMALGLVRASLRAFIAGPVGKAMRPADRWQMVEFDRALATPVMTVARQTTEGLVKYLESLGSINQREVLQVHDRRALDDMREALSSARQLMDLSPRTSKDLVSQALDTASRLRGRAPATDEQIAVIEAAAPRLEVVALLECLEDLLAASGG